MLRVSDQVILRAACSATETSNSLGRGKFWPQGHNLNKLDRGQLGNIYTKSYPGSRPCDSDKKFFFMFSLYSKTCVKLPLKNRQNIDLNDKWQLNEGRKYCSKR